ncbi:MAG: Gfo/Idh/MocA family oxidoreductase [Candidatus Sumerlaeia bacterium]|nr:Gfo/Idh/MocA family oxidoreductase [Candidatus Sumerlaeia bacterium]
MKNSLNRRDFLHRSGLAAATGLAASSVLIQSPRSRAAQASDRMAIGIIGLGGRGSYLMRQTLNGDLADIVALSDADKTSMEQAAQQIEKKQGNPPAMHQDFRKLLEMKNVQAVIIATPDHWHALQTILACQAGKDVFVEKPISHNIQEGLAMIKVVRETKRICQVGLMQRSGQDFKDATAYVQSGKLGKVAFVRAWYVQKRAPLGNPPDGTPPPTLDWDMWLGPAPMRPYNPARYRLDLPAEGGLYGSWRWFWDYAGGQLCDWGPHMLDVVRWGLKVGMPVSAQANGGKFVFTDCRECPDTLNVLYEYPGVSVVWEHRQWTRRQPEPGRYHGIEFFGEKGTLLIDRTGWEVFPEEGGEKAGRPGEVGKERTAEEKHDQEHIANFLECCKSRKDPIMPIEEGFMTTAMCMLGNIAFRTGTKVVWDDATKTIKDNPEAMKLFGRPGRAPWTLPA